MVTTKHCCYGLCRSDSRYGHTDRMKGVFFMPFPKPKTNKEKAKRWVRACGREDFTVDKINRHTYICSLHFVGGTGPTDENPDPIQATAPPDRIAELQIGRKRKRLMAGLGPAGSETKKPIRENQEETSHHIENYDYFSHTGMDYHRANLQRHCRLCAKGLTFHESRYPDSKLKFSKNILYALGVNIQEDDENVHPPFLCRSCKSLILWWKRKCYKRGACSINVHTFEHHSLSCHVCFKPDDDKVVCRKLFDATMQMAKLYGYYLKVYEDRIICFQLTEDCRHVTKRVTVHKNGTWDVEINGTQIQNYEPFNELPTHLKSNTAKKLFKIVSSMQQHLASSGQPVEVTEQFPMTTYVLHGFGQNYTTISSSSDTETVSATSEKQPENCASPDTMMDTPLCQTEHKSVEEESQPKNYSHQDYTRNNVGTTCLITEHVVVKVEHQSENSSQLVYQQNYVDSGYGQRNNPGVDTTCRTKPALVNDEHQPENSSQLVYQQNYVACENSQQSNPAENVIDTLSCHTNPALVNIEQQQQQQNNSSHLRYQQNYVDSVNSQRDNPVYNVVERPCHTKPTLVNNKHQLENSSLLVYEQNYVACDNSQQSNPVENVVDRTCLPKPTQVNVQPQLENRSPPNCQQNKTVHKMVNIPPCLTEQMSNRDKEHSQSIKTVGIKQEPIVASEIFCTQTLDESPLGDQYKHCNQATTDEASTTQTYWKVIGDSAK